MDGGDLMMMDGMMTGGMEGLDANGWMDVDDGWMGGDLMMMMDGRWMDKQMDGWMDRQTDDGRTTDGRRDGGWTDGGTDGGTDGVGGRPDVREG